MRRSAQREHDLEKSVDEQVNGHNMLVYNKKQTPKIIHDRDFLGRCVRKKEGEGFLLVVSPEEREARPITDNVVRGKYSSAMRIKRKGEMEATRKVHGEGGDEGVRMELAVYGCWVHDAAAASGVWAE